MIDLHYWTTPNGHKITMFLEETGLPYKIFPVNIGKGEQFKPEVSGDRAEQPHSRDGRS
jgi:GST-like protein